MDGTRAPLVEVRGLTKRYGQITAVDGVDLTIRRGEAAAGGPVLETGDLGCPKPW